MTLRATELDRLDASEYVAPRFRRDACQGCRHVKPVTYHDADWVRLPLHPRIGGIVSAMACCRWWEPQR